MLLAAEGAAGPDWIQRLPSVVRELERRWGLRVGPPFGGGAVAFVAPALRTDGERVVLKVSILTDETRHEADALELWNGAGAVRLLDADRGLGALLLERAEPGTSLDEHPDRAEAIRIACGVLLRLWRQPPDAHPFDSVQSLASRWAEWTPERFDALWRPFDASIVDEAVAALTALAAWSGERIVANRDFHLGNALAATREPWLAIDPKPLVGEPAFDTGHLVLTLLGDRPTREEAAGWIERLAGLLGLDPERIWTWAFVRAGENSVWALQCDFSAEGDLLAAVALRPGRGSR